MSARAHHYLAIPGLVGAAALLALAGTSCHAHRLPRDAARLTVDGRAEVAHATGDFAVVRGSKVLRPGDRVRMATGTARLDLGRGGKLELREGSEIDFADPVVLRAGDVLVEPEKSPLGVASDDADVQVESGASLVTRTLALTVSSFRGAAVLGSPGGSDLRIRAPRQASVPARGVVPATAQPLLCGSDDSWQQRFLATPCEIGTQLQAAGSGMAAQLPAGEGHTPGFFRLLVPSLEKIPEVDSALDLNRDPGDNLLTSVIAVHSRTGTFSSRVRDVYTFRDQGEDNWGLVALDQGMADADPLNRDLEAAIGLAPKRFAAAFAVASTAGGGPFGAGGAGPTGIGAADGTGVGAGGSDGSGLGNSGTSGGPGGPGSGPGSPGTTIPGSPLPTTPGSPVPTTPGVPTTLLPLPLPIPIPGTPSPATTTTTTVPPGTSPPPTLLPTLPPLSGTTTTLPGPLGTILDPIIDPLGSTATTAAPPPTLPPVTTPVTIPPVTTALTTVTTAVSTVTTLVGGLLGH